MKHRLRKRYKLTEVKRLARIYSNDVRARRALGDRNAAYHAQKPKVEAYRILMQAGLGPKEAIATFRKISEEP